MVSAFFHFQHTLNRLFNNCLKLYWCYISSSWNMKGGQIDRPPEKTTLRKPSLIRVKDGGSHGDFKTCTKDALHQCDI